MRNSDTQYGKMDELSLNGIPFFFITDFLGKTVEIYAEKEINKNGLRFDFQPFKTTLVDYEKKHAILWNPDFETLEEYKIGFDVVKKNLLDGNSYLANYTRATPVETNLTLDDIYAMSDAKYKILYPEKFVCFSPETFVQIKDNQIFTYPMKGTIDADIENAEEILKNDLKEKAEHYTVVDLLRNDLSIVADRVEVTAFQRIDYLQTNHKNLFTMSSEICGEIKPKFQKRIGSVLKNMLPAGSILGAPKKKTLEIILEAERYERGFYTGIAGFFDGKNLDSCVMIRFIEKAGDRYFFKSGGGITHKSTLESEYQEMKNKVYVPIH